MKTSERDIDEMKNEFISYIKSIRNDFLHKLLQEIFDEERLGKFSEHPAGKMWHHSYLGGLIEHTLEIISICDLICKFHKEINRDLLITGAMLHDIGKIIEINSEPGFEYSTEGKLLGHIVIAATMVEKEINKIKNFPDDLRINLLHLILSHQGKLEQASPVVPKTLEAIALYHADELSAKTNAYKLSLERELKSPSGWTKFINLAGTELYSHNSQPQLTIEKETLFD
jgi:3'-5' exoribonuclease